MTRYSNSITEIKHDCADAGFEFRTLERVRKGVYKGTLATRTIGGSKDVYIKIHSLRRKSEFEKFSSIAPDAGHPPCEYISFDEYACLLMRPASGRSLSRLLPIALLPIVWNKKRTHYIQAFRQIGHHLGQLHVHTDAGTGPILDDHERHEALKKTHLLADRVTRSTISDVREIFEQSTEITTQYAITYGDRSPHNLFFDGDTVTQIDAACKTKSVAYEHRGVIMGVRLMARRLPYSDVSKTTCLEDAYWDGYEQENQTDRENTGYLIRFLYGALRLLDTYESPKTLESKLTQWVDPPILVDEIEKAVITIKKHK